MVEALRGTIADCLDYFAELLFYPSERTVSCSQDVSAILAQVCSDCLLDFDHFRNYVENTPLPVMEELYASTFDLQPSCYPYVGYHLFGESYKRGAFLAGLRQEYRNVGFSEGEELPDNLCVVLRFLSRFPSNSISEELTTVCLIPSVQSLAKSLEGYENPYRWLLSSLLGFLTHFSSLIADFASKDGGLSDA